MADKDRNDATPSANEASAEPESVAKLLQNVDLDKIESAVIRDIIRRLVSDPGPHGRATARGNKSSRELKGHAGLAHDKDARFYRVSEAGISDFDKDPHDKDPHDKDPGDFDRDNFDRDNFDRDYP